MKQLYPFSSLRSTFTFFRQIAILSAIQFAAKSGFSQSVTPLSTLPELIFKNPTLSSGTDGKDGAVYKFSLVVAAGVLDAAPNGVDALVTISSRGTNNSTYPASGVRLQNIDIANTDNSKANGYENSWQPQLTYDISSTKQNTTPSINNFDWWMEFQVKFVDHNNNTKSVILSTFDITGLDIDGDGTNVKEYIEFYGLTTYELENPSSLSVETIKSGNSVIGNRYVGVYTNASGIDVSATKVEVTNHYVGIINNSFKFRIGARSKDATDGENVQRMYSIWFKSISYSNPIKNSLPVSLYSFTAQVADKKVKLDWITALELNTSHFVIQRSTDGKNFDDGAIIFTEGNSSVKKSYNYSDNISTLNSNVIYYRLKEVDLDAKFRYSDIVVVKVNSEDLTKNIVTFPNPATNEIRITVPNDWQNKTISYSIYSMNGSLVKQKQSSNSGQTESIKVADLPAGIYIVKAENAGISSIQKFMKSNN